jgi:hypothetical protein
MLMFNLVQEDFTNLSTIVHSRTAAKIFLKERIILIWMPKIFLLKKYKFKKIANNADTNKKFTKNEESICMFSTFITLF